MTDEEAAELQAKIDAVDYQGSVRVAALYDVDVLIESSGQSSIVRSLRTGEVRLISPSTPIDETIKALGIKIDPPAHVRTAGDLVMALERKEIDMPAAAAKATKELIY